MTAAQLIPISVFLGIAAGMWALLSLFSGKESRAAERLDVLKDPRKRAGGADDKGNSVGNVFKAAAPALSAALKPKTELEVSELKIRLANAGYNNPNASTFFLAIKTGLLITGVFIGGGYGLVKHGLEYGALSSVVLAGGFGFYAPEMVLWLVRRSRMEQIFLSLPDALDLLVVCVEAGLGLDAAMRRVCTELKDTAGALCEEFDLANMQLQMGKQRREVLHDLGVRTGVDDMKALVAILIQADRFGSSIAQALRVQSDSMRIKRSQLAEEKAAKTAVKMIFPLVLFIFPGIFVVLVGPAAIMMIRNLLTV
jgi:tight adherence protein C